MARSWGEHDRRAWLADAIREFRLPADRIRILGIREWQWVEQKITDSFVHKSFPDRTGLWFEDLSPPYVIVPQGWTESDMAGLVGAETRVYAAFGDDFSKFWWCSGVYADVVRVVWEMPHVDIKITPASFQWVLYGDHHGTLYAKGEPIQAHAAVLPNARVIASC